MKITQKCVALFNLLSLHSLNSLHNHLLIWWNLENCVWSRNGNSEVETWDEFKSKSREWKHENVSHFCILRSSWIVRIFWWNYIFPNEVKAEGVKIESSCIFHDTIFYPFTRLNPLSRFTDADLCHKFFIWAIV